jgi:hypothetical protein
VATGYTRQSSAFIINGATIEASHHNNEYNALENAFNASSGHNHDGTAGGGAPITPPALSGLSSNGLAARTSATTFAARTLTAPAAGITVTDGNGVSGNPTLVLANDLSGLEGLSTSGVAVRTGTSTWTTRTITGTSNRITVTNGTGVSGEPTLDIGTDVVTLTGSQVLTNKTVTDSTFLIQDEADNTKKVAFQLSALTTATTRTFTFPDQDGTIATLDDLSGSGFQPSDADLTALAALSTTGMLARTAANTYTMRTITGPAAGITVTNGDGVSGNPTLALANDLSGLEGLSGTGLAVRTGTSTWTNRTLTAPAAGITVTDGDGVAGNPTLVLANDLSGLEGLSGTGVAVRTGTSTWTNRDIAVSGSGISISNGSGVSGNPTISIPTDRLLPAATTSALYQNLQVNSAGTAFELVGPLVSRRNKIINGAMRINQQYGSGNVLTTTNGIYFMDGFRYGTANSPPQITATRSTTVPTAGGFTHSLSLTVSSANGSLDATDRVVLSQRIEGLNVADLAIGTSSAKQVTLSFWVRSSITGTYCVFFKNSADNRSYVATYTISVANTYEFKTITVTLDTSGTWLTDTGIGLEVGWDLGSGSNYNGTASAWAGSAITRTSGSTNWGGTGSATFFLTGVQLELGPVATPFEHLSQTDYMNDCRRYYYKTYDLDVSIGSTSALGCIGHVLLTTAAGYHSNVRFPVPMRTSTYTVTIYSPDGVADTFDNAAGSDDVAMAVFTSTTFKGENGFVLQNTDAPASSPTTVYGHIAADARL